MASIIGHRSAGADASRIAPNAPKQKAAAVGSILRVCAAALTAATLGACVQTSMTEKPGSLAVTRQAVPDVKQTASVARHRHVAAVPRKHTPFAAKTQAAKKDPAGKAETVGVASFYGHEAEFKGAQTASGETFNPQALTAAHRTLPFGTQLRVTNLATGQSVMVRVNDRGPFVPGRIVDVSSFAAESLGITERGIAKVKVDIVE
jgi:rare lipoprotein A